MCLCCSSQNKRQYIQHCRSVLLKVMNTVVWYVGTEIFMYFSNGMLSMLCYKGTYRLVCNTIHAVSL